MTEEKGFVGEEAGAGRAPPVLDLVAGAVLIAVALWIMVESVRLKVPDTIFTAPGLLPFVTAGSMGVMAVVLSLGAWRRHRAGVTGDPETDVGDPVRTGGLVAVIAAYLAALEYLAFEYQFRFLGQWLTVGAFELVSVIVTTAILAIFWRKALWQCFVVALVWIFALAAAFRYIFVIPLPG